jgi:P-type Mg2+ transporter
VSNMPLTVLPKHLLAAITHETRQAEVSPNLVELAAMDAADVYTRLATRPEGLPTDEATARLARYSPKVLAKDQRAGVGKLLWHAVLNPLVVLLAVLATVSFATGDPRAGGMMSVLIVLGVGLKLIQEAKADSAPGSGYISCSMDLVAGALSGLSSGRRPNDLGSFSCGTASPQSS